VAAAGNEDTNVPSYPAAYDGVVSVVATDFNDDLSYYSNYGTTVDIAAPGGDTRVDVDRDGNPDGVFSTVGAWNASRTAIEARYDFMQGTSMASPHVAGVVALMLGVNPALRPSDIDSLIASGVITRDLGAVGRDDSFGHGLIDAAAAVRAARGGANSPVLAVSPGVFDLDTNRVSDTFTTRNAGSGALTGVSARSDQAWLAVAPEAVDANGLGSWRVTADPTRLADGTHLATVTVTSSENAVSISVTLQVGAAVKPGDAGLHYIQLRSPGTLALVREVAVGMRNGSYTFELSGVPAGNYLIVATTDHDGDDELCDAGEACGAFPSVDRPLVVSVSGDVSNLFFASELTTTGAPLLGPLRGLSRRPAGAPAAGRVGG
jgi:serine protease